MWIWLKACVATGTPWPSGGFPTAAVLQLFLHLQGAQISSHRLMSPQQRQLPFILDFRGSWGHSKHCRFRELISFLHDLQENMFISTRHCPYCAHSCKHLCKSSLVARQQRLFWQHSSSWWFPQMETFHSKAIHALGWDFWAQPVCPVAATWTTEKLFTGWQEISNLGLSVTLQQGRVENWTWAFSS